MKYSFSGPLQGSDQITSILITDYYATPVSIKFIKQVISLEPYMQSS